MMDREGKWRAYKEAAEIELARCDTRFFLALAVIAVQMVVIMGLLWRSFAAAL